MSAQDVVYAAQSQVGYHEKLTDANLDMFTAPNDGNGNYTKFGKWFGILPSEWCDEFVCWCGDQAGERQAVGTYAYVPAHIQFFKDQGRYFERGEKVPTVGDVIFFEYGYDGVRDGDHVGLVESCDGNYVHTIEGNTKDANGIGCVMRHQYTVTDPYIMGYGRPAYGKSGGVTPELKTEERYSPWRPYKNGSTSEPVYKDTDLTVMTGSLNPGETCECIGRYGNSYLVSYKVDDTADDWAVGYVRYDGLV